MGVVLQLCSMFLQSLPFGKVMANHRNLAFRRYPNLLHVGGSELCDPVAGIGVSCSRLGVAAYDEYVA